MEYLFIYALQSFEALRTLFISVGAVILSLCFIITPAYLASLYDDTKIKNSIKLALAWSAGALILLIISNLIPTKQTLLLMGGTYYGKKAIQQVTSSQKLEKVNTIIDLQLDKYIKELQNGNK